MVAPVAHVRRPRPVVESIAQDTRGLRNAAKAWTIEFEQDSSAGGDITKSHLLALCDVVGRNGGDGGKPSAKMWETFGQVHI